MINEFHSLLGNEEQNVYGLMAVLDTLNIEDMIAQHGGPIFEEVHKNLMYCLSCEIVEVTRKIMLDESGCITSQPGTKESIIDADNLQTLTHKTECNNDNTISGITKAPILFSN